MRLNGEIDAIMAIRVEDARITGLYYVRNPEKLTRVESETPLTCDEYRWGNGDPVRSHRGSWQAVISGGQHGRGCG